MDNRTPIAKFEESLEHFEKKVLLDLLKSQSISPAQFKQVVLTEIKKNPKMLECFLTDPKNLFASIIHCAELGLSPSQSVGEFFFIPYRGHIKPILGYKGIITLLTRNNGVKSIWCESVHEGDVFEYELGLDPILRHIPKDELRTSVSLTHIYAIVKTRDDEKVFKVMSKNELETIIRNLPNTNELHFNDNKDSQFWMLKKIVLKQLAKLLPKDMIGSKAISIDDQMEGGSLLGLDANEQVIVLEDKSKLIRTKSGGLYAKLAIQH
jgi:recombination protein RecT